VASKKFGLRHIIFFSSVKSEKRIPKKIEFFFAKLSHHKIGKKKKNPPLLPIQGLPRK
jgi:hypothetical protein